MMKKERLDILLVEQGFAPSRERAKRLIMAGQVLVDEQRIDKAGTTVPMDAVLRVVGEDLPYVSRGGLKLEKGMATFGVVLKGKTAADIGASTGGFTDCMLQNGAIKVFAIDVGYGQLDWKLRTDARVINMERTNIRNVTAEMLRTSPPSTWRLSRWTRFFPSYTGCSRRAVRSSPSLSRSLKRERSAWARTVLSAILLCMRM